MSAARELREEFEKKLRALQDSCPHIETKWVQSMWAPGHISGSVKVCMRCDKILERASLGVNISRCKKVG